MNIARMNAIAFYLLTISALACSFVTNSANAQQADGNLVRSLDFIPRDALVVASVRPTKLYANQEYGDALRQLDAIRLPVINIPMNAVEEVTMALLPSREIAVPIFKATIDVKSFLELVRDNRFDRNQQFGHQVFQSTQGAFSVIGQNTLLFSTDSVSLARCFLTTSASKSKWADVWSESNAHAVVLANSSMLRGSPAIYELLQNALRGTSTSIGYRMLPLIDSSNYFTLELLADRQLSLRFRASSDSELDATAIRSSLRTAISLGRNGISIARDGMLRSGADSMLPLIDIVDEALEEVRIESRDSQTAAVVSIDGAAKEKLGLEMTRALGVATKARARMASINRLKQVALAFHNYESAYRKFPAAIQEGPDETPRSWRVTVMPFIEAGQDYEKYQQDKTWDSPENHPMLERIPPVFQAEDAESGMTDIFVLNGPDAIFNDGDNSTFGKITDGTSNTIWLVLLPRPIPWTKPEDIPFDVDKPLPFDIPDEGLIVSLADGSVQLIPQGTEEAEIKKAITARGGEVTDLFR